MKFWRSKITLNGIILKMTAFSGGGGLGGLREPEKNTSLVYKF